MKKLDFFRSVNAPYYICGMDYLQSSAGIRVLHYLCHSLNELGEEAYIDANVTSPYLRTPKLTKKVISKHVQAGRLPIAIYPEVITGNPYLAKVAARWILNKPGHIGGDVFHDPSELVFVYQKTYAPEGVVTNPLYIPAVDGRIFNNLDNPYDGKRKGACFYAHKYLVFGGVLTHHSIGATSLCQDIARSHDEIADILRRSEVLYCYEPSAIITEALQCGCPVVIIPSDYIAANYDYKILQGPGVEIGFDENALARAKETLRNFDVQIHYVHARLTLQKFIDLTQQEMLDRIKIQKDADIQLAIPLATKVQDQEIYDYDLWRISHLASRGMTAIAGGGDSDALFHIVIPMPVVHVARLEATLTSIAKQYYTHYRVSVLSVEPVPEKFVGGDISWVSLLEPDFISAYNRIINEDEFDWMLVVEAGDVLEDHALASIMSSEAKHPEWQVIYADEDSLKDGCQYDRPYFKPDYLIDFQRAVPYAFNGCLAVKRELLRELSGFNVAFKGAENFDLMLRTYEKLGSDGIGHIADVLYHRSPDHVHCVLPQDEAIALMRCVLQEHLARIGAAADVENGSLTGTFHIHYHHDGESAVSIIIPTLNGGAMLQSSVNAVVENTEFKNWELIVVDQESDDADTLAFLDYLRGFNNEAVRVITQPRSSNWTALRNAGARVARQDYLLFLSDSTQPLQSDWLDEMLGYAVQPGVGVVGAKAVGVDGKVSNAGYILGLGGQPAGFHDLHVPLDDPGYFGRLQVPGNPSAVSSACMLTEKILFDELGGFDDQFLAAGYSDVDYCLKVGKAGQRVVWTPFALMFQQHMTKPLKEVEVDDEEGDADKNRSRILPGISAQVMFDRWLGFIAFDPAYNRNLSLSLATGEFDVKGFEIETVPALTWDQDVRPLPRILAFIGGGEGREEHRISAPLLALVNAAKVQGADTRDYLSIPELARISPDVLIFQHRQDGHQPNLIEGYARNSKAFRIFELDVLLSNTQLYQDNGLANTLGLSDRLLVPTEYLAYEYRKFSPEIHVVPNYIERAKWGALIPKRRQGSKPRVGWAGSAIHKGDLAIIVDVVKALQDEVVWVFFGLCPEGTRKLVEYHGGVVNSVYPSKLASLNLDLALSPLEDIPLNHAESGLRILEYGALGYPVICSDITPYQGDYPVIRVKNRSEDWVAAIREQISDSDDLARRGDAFRDYVNKNWILEDNLDTWLNAWLPHG